MPSVFELLGDAPQEANPVVTETPGQFGKGLRSGLYGVGANVMALAGAIGDAKDQLRDGAPDRSQWLFDPTETQKRWQAESAASAPRVSSYKDVTSLRDAYDYATGLIGGSVPHSVAAVAGGLAGRTPVGRVLGATLATTPLEMGEIAQRQQADPEIAQQSPVTRLRDMAIGGTLSAGVQSVVPAAVAGKIAAVGTRGAAAPTLRSIPASVAGNVALEGATEAAGEAVKQGTLMQANDARTLDTEALAEAAVGGAVGGAPLAVAGGVADAANVASKTPGNVLAGGVDLLSKGKDAVVDKAKATKEAADEAGYSLDTPVSSFAQMVQDGSAAAKGWWKNVREGKDTVGPEFADMDPADIAAKMPEMDAQRERTVRDKFEEMVRDVKVPEGIKDMLKGVTDFADRAQQATVAKAQDAYDGFVRFKDRAKAFAEGQSDVVDVDAREVPANAGSLPAPKLSKDYSGLRKVIAESIIPTLKKYRPDILTDNESINDAAEGLRKMINRATVPGSTFELEDIQNLEALFGDAANPLMETTFKAMAGNDTAKFEAFAGAMGDVMMAQDSHRAFTEVLKKNIKSDVMVSDNELSDLAWKMERYARDNKLGSRVKASEKNISRAAAARDIKLRQEMRVVFGDKAESVMEALQKRAQADEKNQLDKGSVEKNEDGEDVYEPGDAIDADPRSARTLAERMAAPKYDVQTFEHQKDGLVEWSDDDLSQSKQALARAQERHPDKNVKFMTVDELGDFESNEVPKSSTHAKIKELVRKKRTELAFKAQDEGMDPDAAIAHAEKELKKYGMVVAEGDAKESALSDGDAKALMIDKAAGESHKHPGRMVVKKNGKPMVIDTIKLTAMMNSRMENYPTDDISKSHRLARAFHEGMGSLMEKYGETVEPSNDTPIAILGKNGDKTIYLTYGQAKKLDYRTDEQRADDDMRDWVRSEHKKYKTAKAAGDKTKAEAIWRDIQAALNDMEFNKARELVAGAEETGERVFSFGESFVGKDGVRRGKNDSKEVVGRKKQAASAYFDADGNITNAGMQVLMDGYEDAGIDMTVKRRPDMDGDTQFEGSNVTKRYLERSKREKEMPKSDSSPVAGASEVDPFGNIHYALRNADKGAKKPITTDMTGEGRIEREAKGDKAPIKAKSPNDYPMLRAKFEPMLEGGKPPQQAMAKRALWVIDNAHTFPATTRKKLMAIAGSPDKNAPTRKLSDVMAVIDPIYENFNKDADLKAGATEPVAAPAPAPAAKAVPNLERLNAKIDDMMIRESYDSLTTDDKTIAFLRAAYRRYNDLKAKYDATEFTDESDMTDTELAAFDRLANAFSPGSREDLTSFFPNFPDAPMTDSEIRTMLKAGSEVSAKGPKGEARKSAQATNPSKTTSAVAEKLTRQAIDDMLGNAVKVEFVPLQQHAGEYTDAKGQGIIRISGHALNPLSVGYHESLHAFVSLLAKDGNAKIAGVLMKKAMEPHIQRQLKSLLANEPDALAQLADPEEAAAYMFQFWMDGKVTVATPKIVSFFTMLRDAIANMVKQYAGMNIWSSDTRAENIMKYLKDGNFKKNLNDPAAVHAALWEAGRDARIEKAKALAGPVLRFGDALLTPAATRLRETGVPALRALADLSKRQLTGDGADPGYLPAARYRYTRFMNKLAGQLQQYDKDTLAEALEAMQDPTKKPGVSADAQAIIDIVQGPGGVLQGLVGYMARKGVDVKRLQPRKDYFPRVYDIDYIARHEKDFVAVLEKHQIPDARGLVRRLIANEGNEFTVETNAPGHQNLKERKLAVIPDSELAQFMVKDAYKILSGNIMQSTRRAEWAERFGDDGGKLTKMLEEAKRQGASKEDLTLANEYVKAINGTLGDDINPTARRLMGNVIVYQNVRLLPLAIFSNLVDPVGIMVRGGTVSDAFEAWKRSAKEIRNSFRKTYAADADVKLAEALGTIDNAVLAHEMSSLYTQGMVGDTAKKINDTFFRWNLTEGMQRGMRVAATQAAIKFIERHKDGTASIHSVRWLAELGLKPGDVTGPIDEKSNALVKAAVNRWVDGAVLRPDAADRALWMSDPHYMLFAHLKQFAFAFQETILKRVFHEYKHGNYAPVMALASYVPFMIAADSLKHMLQGGGELPEWKRQWGLGDYVGAGIERAGLLGARQFGVDAVQDLMRGEAWMGSLTGPAIDQMMEGLSVFGGRVDGGSWLLDALPANAVYEGVVK